ncbi:MAG: hypothetical protein WCK65_02795 [Rhodospirillaceae bacterium]
MVFDFGPYDHYLFAALAILGTFSAAWFLLWLSQHSPFAPFIHSFRGVAPNFLSVIGVVFALNLVFLANDTWHAHDRALDAVFQEAGSLRSILALIERLQEPSRGSIREVIKTYAGLTVNEEWPALAQRQSVPAAANQLDVLLDLLTSAEVARSLGATVQTLLLQQAIQVRGNRAIRIAVSQTHINPLKWLGMAFLGFVMMVSIVMVHVDQARAEVLAIMLFAAAAAPTVAIVLVQGNPFQQPTAVSSAPISALR